MAIVSAYQINSGDLPSGFYQVYDEYEANVLGLGGGYFSVIHNYNAEIASSPYVSQIIFPYNCSAPFAPENNGNIMYRYKTNATWSPYIRLYQDIHQYLKVKDSSGIGPGSSGIYFIDEAGNYKLLNSYGSNLSFHGSTILKTDNAINLLPKAFNQFGLVKMEYDSATGTLNIKTE